MTAAAKFLRYARQSDGQRVHVRECGECDEGQVTTHRGWGAGEVEYVGACDACRGTGEILDIDCDCPDCCERQVADELLEDRLEAEHHADQWLKRSSAEFRSVFLGVAYPMRGES